MIDIPDGFTFRDVYCYPAGDESHAFYYLPLSLRPELAPSGKPTLMSIPMAAGGFLQLGTHLGADDETVEALRQELARREGLDDAGLVRLMMAPLQVKGARLLLGDGQGELAEVASSTTSGFPPYTALFQATLDATQQAAVTAALNGREGFVQVRYDTNLPRMVSATAHLKGDVTDVFARLGSAPDETDLQALMRSLLEEGLADGWMVMTVESNGDLDSDLVARAREETLDRAAALLLKAYQSGQGAGGVALGEASTTLSQSLDQPLSMTIDVATWFESGEGTGQIQLMPGSSGRESPEDEP